MILVNFRSASRVSGQTMVPVWRPSRFVAMLRGWIARAQQRHELSGLSDEQLRDVGLNRDIVKREREKPFWQV